MSVYKATLNSHGMNHQEASLLMDTARNRANGKPLENNTRLFDRGDHFAVRLHNTDVVRIYPDGWSLHTGGYSTVTTKDRLNKYGPLTIYQRDWIWYVAGRFTQGINDIVDDPVFTEGMFVKRGTSNLYPSRTAYLDECLLKQEAIDETEAVE